MEWISFDHEKPKESGYYWFALRECGDSYSCYTTQKYDYFTPDLLDYGILAHEYYEDEAHFRYVVAWMKPPEWPFKIPNSEARIKDIKEKQIKLKK